MKKTLYIIVPIILIAFVFSQSVFADVTTDNLPTSAVDAANGDGWVNPTNVETDSTLYAIGQSLSSGFSFSGDLEMTGYNFSIPSNATITGVVYTIKRQALNGAFNKFEDRTISLIKGGVISGNNKAVASAWSSSTTTVQYGSSSDLWGLSLTPTDVNASNFGADFNGQQTSITSDNGNVYYVKLTIYYTLPSPTYYSNVSINKSNVVINSNVVIY